jgi:hypothetical protein
MRLDLVYDVSQGVNDLFSVNGEKSGNKGFEAVYLMRDYGAMDLIRCHEAPPWILVSGNKKNPSVTTVPRNCP